MAKKRNKRPRHTKEVMEETEADDTQPLQLHNAQALNFVKKPEITIKCQRPGCTKIIQRFEVDHYLQALEAPRHPGLQRPGLQPHQQARSYDHNQVSEARVHQGDTEVRRALCLWALEAPQHPGE